MPKFLSLFLTCLFLSSFSIAQPPVNIKNRLLGVEGVNFLRHGIYNYQLRITDGLVEYVYFQDRPMTKIDGDQKKELLINLLGTRVKEYEDLSCECLSLWQKDEVYTILEIDEKTEKEDYRIGYHIIRD